MPTPAVAVGAGMPATSMPVPAVAMAQPATHHQQPQFGFQEISGLTLTALMSHVVINEQVEMAVDATHAVGLTLHHSITCCFHL